MTPILPSRFPDSAPAAKLWLGALLIAAIPAANIAYLVATYGVDVPLMDDWEYVPLIDRFIRGDWALGDLFALHNEHRPALFRAWRLLSVPLFGLNLILEQILSVLFAGITYGIIAWEVVRNRNRLGTGMGGAFRMFALSSLFVFSPTQWENFLWAHQLSWFIQNAFAAACLAVLAHSSRSWLPTSVAVFLGLCGTFAHGGGGLVLWPLGVVFYAGLYLTGRRPRGEITGLLIWTAATVVVFFAYFQNYQRPEHHPDILGAIEHPLQFVTYLCGFLGNAVFFENVRLAIASGAVAACFFVVGSIWTVRMKTRLPSVYEAGVWWVLLAGYGAANALVTALARSGFGAEQALSSRYVAMAALFWIGTYALVELVLVSGERSPNTSQRRRTVLLWLLGASVATPVLVSYLKVEPAAWFRFHNRLVIGRDALAYGNDDRDLLTLHHTIGRVLALAPVLKDNRLSLFRHPETFQDQALQDGERQAAGLVESWGDDASPGEARVEGCTEISGWAVDPDASRPAVKVFVLRGREVMAAAPVRALRPDVAVALGSPDLVASGWSVTLCGRKLGPGESVLSVYVQPGRHRPLVKIGEHRIDVISLSGLWQSVGEVIYDVTPDTCARQLIPVHEAELDCGDPITLVSRGRAPYFATLPLELEPRGRRVLKLELSVDHEDMLRVFAGRPGGGFSGSDAQTFTLFQGDNEIFVELPRKGTISGVVFSPGTRAGLYDLGSFTLKQFPEGEPLKQ